ncbi:redox-sensitive transcriptional activator SoxR [Acinetobacter sp. PK01]|uniref:redox-sensitive transcriptional activator SoxR n=1 Tax=Acinetobacter sp. PK01 TaxID=2930198 RepID=UPI001FB773DB|nr:redox-sensitive transcriptional activator SoxR [Acinetobacter sp. PK01]UOG18095.1 redox-sensitive transcriptional activator SoxR [Acinetobacter sp. PK01]
MEENPQTMSSAQQWLRIGDLAKRSDVSVAALRFYEEKELIWSARTSGNQRRYQRSMLRRIAIIKAAQQVGISLQQVKVAFSALPKQGNATKQDWQQMSQQWQTQLDQQIVHLLQLRQQLDWCIGCGCLSLEQCPLRNPNDVLAETSAGAHFHELLLKMNSENTECSLSPKDDAFQ